MTRVEATGGNEAAALSSVISQKQDLKNKYLQQVEVNQQLEQENEQLKKQVLELSDMSFVRGGGGVMHGGFMSVGGNRGGGGANENNFGEDMLNASSIERGD